MSKRRRQRLKKANAPTPELGGVAKLLSETPVAALDLHGYTAVQARPRVRDFLATHSRVSAGSVVHIITGKGANSPGHAVLLGLVRDMFADEVADWVDEYAGLPGGGGWVVRVR
jgi:DNA-nicking Smr family endonuclease